MEFLGRILTRQGCYIIFAHILNIRVAVDERTKDHEFENVLRTIPVKPYLKGTLINNLAGKIVKHRNQYQHLDNHLRSCEYCFISIVKFIGIYSCSFSLLRICDYILFFKPLTWFWSWFDNFLKQLVNTPVNINLESYVQPFKIDLNTR